WLSSSAVAGHCGIVVCDRCCSNENHSSTRARLVVRYSCSSLIVCFLLAVHRPFRRSPCSSTIRLLFPSVDLHSLQVLSLVRQSPRSLQVEVRGLVIESVLSTRDPFHSNVETSRAFLLWVVCHRFFVRSFVPVICCLSSIIGFPLQTARA
ncbi:hypothetical protein T310_6662, partial [Rasamsonia emersonii CBS 393.64]